MVKLPKRLIFIVFLFVFLIVPASVYAKSKASPKLSILPKNEVITRDYFAIGEKVTLSGTVEGDAYVAGGDVLIDGSVRGDLLVAGGTVNVTGDVGQDIRVAGGTVNINGEVGRNVGVAGGSVTVGQEAKIAGNLAGFFSNLEYLGSSSNLFLAGDNAYLDGRTQGNVTAKVNTLTLGENEVLMGDLSYESKQEAEIASGAQVLGKTAYKPLSDKAGIPAGTDMWGKTSGGLQGVRKGFSVVSFLLALLVGFLMIRIFPRRMAHMRQLLTQQPWKNIVLGILLLFVTPFAVLLFVVTIVGIPIAIIWLFALAILIYLAKIIVGYWLGFVILKRIGAGERRGWALFVGLLVYYILKFIPYVGWLVSLLVLLAGMGVYVREKVYIYRRLAARKIL